MDDQREGIRTPMAPPAEPPRKEGRIEEIIGETPAGVKTLTFQNGVAAHVSAEGMRVLQENAEAQGLKSPVGLRIAYTTDERGVMVDFMPMLEDFTVQDADRAALHLGVQRAAGQGRLLVQYQAGIRTALNAKDVPRVLIFINAYNKCVRRLHALGRRD